MHFIAIEKEQNNYSNYSALAFSEVLHLLFTSNYRFCFRGRKNIFALGRKVP